MLQLKEVSKSYREGQRVRAVLEQVTFAFREGSFSALLGRSGSGKSTLLHLLAGLDRPDRGEIWCRDVNLSALSQADMTLYRRRHIGFVFQFFHLFPTLTVRENVALILELAGQPPGREQELLQRVGLWDRRDSFPDVLSGGEQQRVAVARALVHRPALVLADEPTGNLDQENSQSVLELLKEMCRAEGSTLVVATHSKEVADAADEVLVIRSGRLEPQPQ